MEPQTYTSCFIPDTSIQFAWDSTSLGWFKDCPRKYFYHQILGIFPRGSNVHLSFGLWYQSALELYDKFRCGGISHDSAIASAVLLALTNSWGFAPEGETKKTRENLIRTIIWKLDRFEHDVLETITLHDGTPAVELSFRFEIEYEAVPGWNYMLCGHFDRLVKFSGDPFVVDNKTTGGTLSPYYFKQYSPHNQMSLYTVAGKVVYHTPVKGVIIDAAQVMVGFSEFGRGFSYRTEGQNEEWIKGTVLWLGIAKDCATDHDEIVADNIAEFYPPRDPAEAYPMNDKSCDKFGGCCFQEICNKDPSVRKNFLDTGFEKRKWNPLETRE